MAYICCEYLSDPSHHMYVKSFRNNPSERKGYNANVPNGTDSARIPGAGEVARPPAMPPMQQRRHRHNTEQWQSEEVYMPKMQHALRCENEKHLQRSKGASAKMVSRGILHDEAGGHQHDGAGG